MKYIINVTFTSAIFRLLVDGGSDRWMKFVMDKNLNDLPAPSVLSGDFDSASEESLKYFQCRGSEVLRTPNQDETVSAVIENLSSVTPKNFCRILLKL